MISPELTLDQKRIYVRKKLRDLGPSLLKPRYRTIWTPKRPTTGYCYLVSEALYHYAYPRSSSYVINLGEEFGTHWFLRDPAEGLIDFTEDQFDFDVPHEAAKRAAFFKGSVRTERGMISYNGYLLAIYLKLTKPRRADGSITNQPIH